MNQYKVRVQRGNIAETPEQAAQVASGLSNKGGLILKA